jgi:hypothetical protein
VNDSKTRLEPLPAARARELLDLMHRAARDDKSALALDDTGHVTGVVPAAEPYEAHTLGDLDVHA